MSVAAALKKTNKEYAELLAKLDDIPTLPVVAMKVNDLVNDPTSSGKQIAEVLKKDQVLTAKILKLANSSYYAIPGGVTDVQRALAFLGFNTLAQLILGLSVVSLFSEMESEDFTMMDFWKHALGTAVCAEMLSKHLKHSKPEEAFTCGLLHDIGKLVLNEIDPDILKTVVRKARQQEKSFYEIERELELPTHSFLGELIAKKWGLPQVIQLSIRYHHQDVSQMATLLSSEKPRIQVVRLANALAVKNQVGKSGDYSKGEVTEDMLKPLGLRAEDLPQLEQRFLKGMEIAGAFLSVYR